MDTSNREAIFARSVIYTLGFSIPLIVLLGALSDIFTSPKALLILTGVSLLSVIYLIRFFFSGHVTFSTSPSSHLVILLFILVMRDGTNRAPLDDLRGIVVSISYNPFGLFRSGSFFHSSQHVQIMHSHSNCLTHTPRAALYTI